jgi:hypothetical protein
MGVNKFSPYRGSKRRWRTSLISGMMTGALLTLPFAVNAVDLNGEWLGEGYKCGFKTSQEKVQIVQKGNSVEATKITGDNCVPAGNNTFSGTLDGNKIQATWTTGTPNKPACCQTKGHLLVVDNNTLKSSVGVIYKRVTTTTATNAVDLNGEWLGEGYKCGFSTLEEKVQIVQKGNSVEATKITGDKCVPAGTRTFSGTINGNKIPATWTTGSPNRPACCQTKGHLLVVDNNTLKSSVGVIYKRVPSPSQNKPSDKPDTTFYISGKENPNKCFHKKNGGWANGNPLHIWDCNAGTGENKMWVYDPKTGYIKGKDNPNKCFHKKNGGWANGNPLHIWDCNAGPSQNKTWLYDPKTGYIKGKENPNKCFHKKNGGWANGNPLHIWDCHAGPSENKTWNFGMKQPQPSQPQADLNKGLIAHYPFDGHAKDASGNNHHCTTAGDVSYANGKMGQAAKFNGKNGVISTTLPKVKKTYTVSMFAMLYSNHRVENQFFYLTRKNHKDRLGYLSTYPVGQNKWHFGSRRYGKGWEDRGTTIADPDGMQVKKWYHLAFVLNNKEISLYANGKLLKTLKSKHHSNIEAHSNLLFLMGGTTEKYQWMDGLIDEVRFYNRALSAAEIKTLSQATTKPAPTEEPKPSFSCEKKKNCGDMASCEEAKYHLQQCGNKRLDNDKDGIPCESICEK